MATALPFTAMAQMVNGPACDTYTNRTTANGLGDNFVSGVYATSTAVYAATNGGLSFCSPLNTNPTITPAVPLTRQQNNPSTVSTIATVNDAETAAGSLIVTATTIPAGLTVTGITNTGGTITSNVAASASATLGNNTIVLTVTDGGSLTATASLIVNVTPPPPPPTGCPVANLQQPINYATADTPSAMISMAMARLTL